MNKRLMLTSGEWRYVERGADSLAIVTDDDRQPKTWVMKRGEKIGAVIATNRKPRTLALINWVIVRGVGYHEAEANARLMAAAKDLCDAVGMLLPMAEAFLAGAPTHPDNAKLESARAALRKAGQ